MGFLCVPASGTRACGCAQIDPLEVQIQHYIKDEEYPGSLVFSGTVVTKVVTKERGLNTIKVKQLWKGAPQRYIVLANFEGSCEPDLRQGQSYLIYA